jgi:hypothetical protein
MNKRLKILQRRREYLVSRAAAERGEISYIAIHLQKRLWLVDLALAVTRAIRNHPAMALRSATLVMSERQNKTLIWTARLLTAWEIFDAMHKQWRRRQD